MENSHSFFKNTGCKYYPCHSQGEMADSELNCMFCYCPLYNRENCPGTPVYIGEETCKIKDCSQCTFPHRPENYEIIISMLSK